MGDAGTVSLVPLGISLVGAALAYGAARRARIRRAGPAAFALAGYVLTVLALSVLVPGPAGRPGLVLGSLVIALVALALALRSEEHTSELQSRGHLVCRLLLEKNKS